jgi:hypothetical protein
MRSGLAAKTRCLSFGEVRTRRCNSAYVAIHRYGHNGSAWTGQALSILSKCSRTASALPLSPLIRLIGIEEYRHPVKWLIDP